MCQEKNEPSEQLTTEQPSHPMKWYKLIIWVQLFLGALGMASNAYLALTGTQYGAEREVIDAVYAMFGALRVVDIVFGVLYILGAVACILVRQELAKFKKRAPLHYYIVLGSMTGLQILHVGIASLAAGLNAFDFSLLSQVVICAGMIACSKIYFDKRADLFCN